MSLQEIANIRKTGYKPVHAILLVGKKTRFMEEIQPFICSIEVGMGSRNDLRPLFGLDVMFVNAEGSKDDLTALFDDLVEKQVNCLAYDGVDLEYHAKHELFKNLAPRKLMPWSKEDTLWKP
jgi:hypothetical protein